MSTALLSNAGEGFATLVISRLFTQSRYAHASRDPPYAKPVRISKNRPSTTVDSSRYSSSGPLDLQLIAETRVEAAHLRRQSTHRTALRRYARFACKALSTGSLVDNHAFRLKEPKRSLTPSLRQC